MRQCLISLQSATPYSQSKRHWEPLLNKEGHEDYDLRTWRHKATVNDEGIVCIPGMGLKMAIDEAIKRLNITVPGAKGATYTKFFVAGHIPDDVFGMSLGIKLEELEVTSIYANLDGIRGSAKRGRRYFPYIRNWSGTVAFNVLDDRIPKEIYERTVIEAGKLVGIGRFRPEKGGFLGRFNVLGFEWSEV